MVYLNAYKSPLGPMMMASDGQSLIGLWFDSQNPLFDGDLNASLFVFKQTKKWLDVYFSGKRPNFVPPFVLQGTEFQKEVWSILLNISYGQTTTYGEIAKTLAKKHCLKKMSAQAVGNAVRKNPIVLIVPCHRVIGQGGKLVGYAGGLDKKACLLKLERLNKTQK